MLFWCQYKVVEVSSFVDITPTIMPIPVSIQQALDKPLTLTQQQIDFYQKNRFIKVKEVFNAETLEYFNSAISRRVAEMNKVTTKVDDRDTYGKAFLQLFNLWREDEVK
jgi:hypothetical protein